MDGFQLLSALMSESGGDSLRILRAHIAEQKDARRVHVSWSRPTESDTRRIRFDVHRLDTQMRVSGSFVRRTTNSCGSTTQDTDAVGCISGGSVLLPPMVATFTGTSSRGDVTLGPSPSTPGTSISPIRVPC